MYNLISKPIRVLLISDRLPEQAMQLAQYLQCNKSINVVGIALSMQQALHIAHYQTFDYLIIVGYLKPESNYKIISELQKLQKEFLTVQWSMLDPLIEHYCKHYRIPLKFERTRPMKDFADFLIAHKDNSFHSHTKHLNIYPSK